MIRSKLAAFAQSHKAMFWSSYCGLLVTGLVLAGLVHLDYRRTIHTSQEAHDVSCTNELDQLTLKIDKTIGTIYQNLRMIARLPGVRDLDYSAANNFEFHGGGGLEGNTRVSVQEIYNNLASSVDVSELYIIPANLDPDAGPDETDKARKPWITFDQLILNQSHDTQDDPDAADIEEIEIHEYRLMRQQLIRFRQEYPTLSTITGLNYPALFGSEVVTCDNRYYSASDPDDSNRKGMVISVPFYGPEGDLRGSISAIILTRVLKNLLPNGNFAITGPRYGYFIPGGETGQSITSQQYASAGVPDLQLMCSQARNLTTHDAAADDWVLWMGNPDTHFWSRPDADAAIRARNIGYGFVVFFFMTAGPGVWLILRGQKQLKLANLSLEHKVRDQTLELKKALDTYQNQTHAIDQHAGLLVADVQGNISQINNHLCQLSGYRSEELIDQHWNTLNGTNFPENLRRQIWEKLALGHTWSGELQQRAKDGCHYWVKATTVPIQDESGKIFQYICVQTDISDYKNTQNRLLRDAMNIRDSA